MARKPKETSFKKAFGAALDHHLKARRVFQAALANEVGVTPSYLNRTMYGTRTASPQLVDAITGALNLASGDATLLHQAAAVDAGYKISIPEKDG